MKTTNDPSVLKIVKRYFRKRSHRETMWRAIHELRQEIVDDVLHASRDEETLLNPELLVHKANLIRKYSRRLKILNI